MESELPFFIFQGDTDAVTPTAKAKEYFDEVRAPHKQFVLIAYEADHTTSGQYGEYALDTHRYMGRWPRVARDVL